MSNNELTESMFQAAKKLLMEKERDHKKEFQEREHINKINAKINHVKLELEGLENEYTEILQKFHNVIFHLHENLNTIQNLREELHKKND